MYDRLLDGTLADKLCDWRRDGATYLQIRDELVALGVPVSVETVRRWCASVGAHPEAVSR